MTSESPLAMENWLLIICTLVSVRLKRGTAMARNICQPNEMSMLAPTTKIFAFKADAAASAVQAVQRQALQC